MGEPEFYVWLIAERLAVAERPGGGGRSHRIARRDAELGWWKEQRVGAIVSGMRTRHGLVESALAGFRIRWHPLVSPEQGAREMPALVASVRAELDAAAGAVLVHVDRPGEWLAGVDATLRRAFGLARTRTDALRQAAADGLPVGEIAATIVGSQLGGAALRRPRETSSA